MFQLFRNCFVLADILIKINNKYTLFINGVMRGRVRVDYMKARQKGLLIQMKTKQSIKMQVVSLVFLEISRQLGSDSCLLMTTTEIPGFTRSTDMIVWF